ncbi:MAG: Gfo/Idh/MocA family oxidoreductase [Planctomycetaceae bacterium]|jgi:predicted dehydrogenase|nr:Gfo/Idh/MocA family oxidoreductase [Planctomycetaceae bacterium]
MFLTDEQKAIGTENFFAAIGSDLVRREFLQNGMTRKISSKNGLGGYYFNYGKLEKPIRVAVLGTGDEGSILIGALNPAYCTCTAIADIRPYSQYRAFHGDVYSEDITKLRPGLMRIYGWETEEIARQHVKVYGDYNELLEAEQGNIDAVIIAMPLHLHAPAAIKAMSLGYHVLTEKLMGHSVANCKEMARASAKFKKHLVTGHQRHYNILYDHVKKLIDSGILGDLHYIRAQWHRNNQPGADSWQMPMPKNFKPNDNLAGRLERELASWKGNLAKAEANLKGTSGNKRKDIEAEIAMWKGRVAQKEAQLADAVLAQQEGGEAYGFKFKTVEEYGYQSQKVHNDLTDTDYERSAGEELIRWRIWDRTGGGLMAELGSHQLDAASIFIAAMNDGVKQHPISVAASAVRNIFPLDRDADDHVHCIYEYPLRGYDPDNDLKKHKKITVAYSSINGNGFGGYGEEIYGTQGTLVITSEKEAFLYRTAGVNEKTRVAMKNDGKTLDLVNDDAGDPLSASIGLQALYGDISRGYAEEIEHWAYCISTNPDGSDPEKIPRCHPKIALGDAVIALTTNLAMETETPIVFKEEWFEPDSDETPDGEKPDLAKYGV